MHFKAIKSAEQHLGLVQKECGFYRECLDASNANCREAFPVVPPPGSCLAANSQYITVSIWRSKYVLIYTNLEGKKSKF